MIASAAHQGQKLLGEKGLAAAPVQHRIQHPGGIGHLSVQARQQRFSLLALQATELHRVADVEGGSVGAADQVVGGSDAQKTKGESLVGGMLSPALVQRADQAEKAIGIERQTQQVVDLLHKKHNRRRDARQQDLIDELPEALHRA